MAAPAAAVAQREDADRLGLQERLDDVVAAGAVGALAEVRDDEDGVHRARSGVAALGTNRPVPLHGRFRAGSITKTFLATVVLQLVDKNRLRLDDSVERWLPGVVPGGDKIKVRHLLNHTSGLFDFRRTLQLPPSPEFLEYRWRTWTPAEQVARAVARPPRPEPPGTVFEYSNTNYTLLGMIVEKVTGRSYAKEIERRLIWPLGLSQTTMPGTSPWIRGPYPRGYAPVDRGGEKPDLVDFTEMNPSLFGAAGELISTTKDLSTFFAALLGGHLLPDHLLDEMKKQGVPGGRKYGLGLAWIDTTCGVRAYGNDGDALSYQSWAFTSEDLRRQVTVVATPNFDGDPDDAVEALLDEAFCD
ncbi:serine hydrolase domain-containing protein [Nocardioides speluncae]|uniref:serine hydrolase domain-containing protein n=1 Tax=Nocardioides speluncae TaxID=2670337 RepID=UPI001F0BC292|nr:serine hydrolase domain-containing protein [Nocardioides speluncae]